MKSKLASSFYLYLAGTCWRNTRSTMASRSMITLPNCRRCQISCSFQAKGLKSSSRAAHSSAENDVFSELGPALECSAKKIELSTEKPDDFVDDDFSDLGLEMSECSAKKIKLVTEKSDHLPKTRSRRKESHHRPLSSDNRSSVNKTLSAANGMTSGPKLGRHGHSPTSTDDIRKASDIEGPLSVSIKNVPSTVGLTELVESISIFGKVLGASFVTGSNKHRCCNIEFDNVESSRKAIMAGQLTVGNQVFPIDCKDAVGVVTIRIKNISEKTSDYGIHSICKSVGELVGLTRTSKDCADAFFNVPNHSTHLDIVKKLNATKVDLNCWLATSKSESSEAALDEEARYKLGLQIFYQISKLKEQFDMQKVHFADLEHLNASIMHMEHVDSLRSGSR